MNPITYNFTGAIQSYTVQVSGTYGLTATGAQGGASGGGSTGGLGAAVGGNFALQSGEQLLFVVGGVGQAGGNQGGGGGGGSFVYVDTDRSGTVTSGDNLLLAAGGGGGAGFYAGNTGTGGYSADDPAGRGSGSGGASGTSTQYNGAGGAGINGAGADGVGARGGFGAATITGNGTGNTNFSTGGNGGYGGGGGAGYNGGGGGGGYTGGAGGAGTGPGYAGGGGRSFNADASATRTTVGAFRQGDGQASLNLVARAPANPAPPANNAPCYCTGTRILTDRGEVAVETLAIGDVVVTAAGEHRSIRWIGNRSYSGRFANTNPAVLPVCVKAGALADSVPTRDLWVSPDHALYLDGVLIPAEHLVNGATIVKADAVESVTYWHVELDSHDVLLAEGAPAESFVDDHGRAIFHNAASYRDLYPHAPAWSVPAVYCAERIKDGYALEAVRRRLALRAGLPLAPARVFGELLGSLDLCDGNRITGWAQDLAHSDGPVCLDIVVDGAVVAMACAEIYRADLEAAGIGDGCHAFDLELPQALAAETAHTVEVRRSADRAVVGILRVEAAIAVAA